MRYCTGMLMLTLALLASSLQAEELRSSLAAELGWVKFRVTAGRLQIVNTHFRESRTFEAGNPLVGETETFRLNISASNASARYDLNTRGQRLTVDFDSPYSVTIERTPTDEDDESITPVKFVQPRDGRLQLTIGRGLKRREIKAESFWHLMLSEPEAAREHLLPILLSLRPGWPLEDTAAGIESALVQVAGSDALPDREAWAKLVDQLGSSSFADRRRAERQLRSAGPAVVAYLKTLPLETLDAERRSRVERLLDSLSSTADDTPGRIAVWLIDDATVWTTVLASDDADHRRAAHEQLEKLLGRKIEFDVDADAESRAEQINQLRKTL